ncbi:hypothetical protein SR41_04680 [Sphingomonas melonis]|uniref:Uncharacterized protein n=1 Tax=Sphingomonas melonis TaxID=152682 RepID=A0A0D1MFX0_9SPHN|nr:hypothetical protein [Sphingomonas melonis]KIU29307.1 hypothetical protein SR41_04680 [Sphingomonas melonis]
MTKALAPATVAIAIDIPSRVQDGSNRTHAAGGTVSIDGGRSYTVYVTRHHVKQSTAWERRGVYYGCELYLNGRKVRETALVAVRELVEKAFRRAVNEMSFQADKDLPAQDVVIAADAVQAELVAKAIETAPGLKTAIRDLRARLVAYAADVQEVDAEGAKFISQATSDLFAAFLKVRTVEERLEAQSVAKPIPASRLTDDELLAELTQG